MSDPFDQFDPYPGDAITGLSEPVKGTLSVASAAKRERINDPFSQFDPFPDEDVTGFAPPIGEEKGTSATGAFARGAARSAAPAIGSLPAIGAGAELGAVAGPFGAIAGGIAGGLGGGYLISKAQDWALSKLPDTWVEALGMSERQEKLDQKYHGTASFLGGLAPYAITMRPGLAPRGALPENATALQRIMANPATAHVFGGGVVGGLELGQELAHGEAPDWAKVAISTGFGVVFNRPTEIGKTLERFGQRPFLRVVPTPEAHPAPAPATTEAAAEPVRPAAETAPAAPTAPTHPVTAADWRAEMTERDRRGRAYPPTVADAADLKVMGPGITEDVFRGSHEQSPAAEQSAKEAKRTEQSVIGPDQAQDIHTTARRMDADLFDRYDTAQIQRSTFERWLADHPESTQAKQHLDALNAELAELRPQIQAAYRRAAEATGGQLVEPEAPAAPPAPRTIEQQRDAIRNDVTRRLILAGRSKDEAEAAGALIAARYETRAATLRGARGTAEELYRAEAPEILGPGARTQQILPPRPERPVNEAALSLLQFLAHKGGLKRTADLESILDKNPTVGRFGKLFRDEGMSVDRAREAASEAGYLVENVERTGKQATVRDLLDAIQNETRGRKIYRPGQEPTAAAENPLGPEPPLEGGQEAARPPETRSELMTEEDEAAATELLQRPQMSEEEFQQLFEDIQSKSREREKRAEALASSGKSIRLYHAGNRMALAGPDMSKPGKWRITYFEDSTPIGHSEFSSLKDAIIRGLEEHYNPRETTELLQREQAPPFYSAVERAVTSSKQAKASPSQWLGMIKNMPGVKPEEMEWLGLEDWLKEQKGSVTKEQIQDYIRANQIEVKEVPHADMPQEDHLARDIGGTLGPMLDNLKTPQDIETAKRFNSNFRETAKGFTDEQILAAAERARQFVNVAPTKFASYQLPGGENYRELLLTLPQEKLATEDAASRYYETFVRRGGEPAWNDLSAEQRSQYAAETPGEGQFKEPFRSSHFEEPNILAHIRFNERTIDGKRTLFVEEVQSDWHQAGKRKGYKGQGLPDVSEWAAEKRGEKWSIFDNDGRLRGEVSASEFPDKDAAIRSVASNVEDQGRVPDAPFKTTWPELAMKRMIRYAAENGYDKVAWTTGETQAERYDLSKQISKVEVQEIPFLDESVLTAWDHSGKQVINTHVPTKDLPDHIGKEAADKILGQKPEDKPSRASFQEGNLPTRTLEGLDLKVGGEGMKGFYDQILPAAVNKLVKKFGGRVGKGTAQIPNTEGYNIERAGNRWRLVGGDGQWIRDAPLFHTGADAEEWIAKNRGTPVHSLDITDKLHEAAMEQGFPLFQQARGGIQLNPQRIPGRDFLGAEDVKPILRLTRDANASTFIHESGHQFLAELMRDAEHEAAPDQLKADAKTTLKWLGVEKAEDIGRRHHEKFATGFEQYLREGTAPSPALARIFAQFRQWLLNIYQTIKGLGQPINEDIRGVFDRMLAEEPQRTVIAPEKEPIKTLADLHAEDAREIEPAASDAAAARVAAEGWTDYDKLPDDIRAELEAEDAKFFAGHEPTIEPGGPPSGGAGRVRPFQPLGGVPESIEPGRVGGVPHGAEPEGATRPARQGNPVSGQRPASEGPGGERANLGDLPLAPNAAADLTRTADSFNVGKDGNVRTENITSVDQFARAIEEAKDRIPGTTGPMTDGEVLDAAQAMGFTPDELSLEKLTQAFGGVKDLNKKVLAFRQAVREQAERVADLMARIRDTDDDALVAEYGKERERFDMFMSVLSSVTSEWGRAGRAFRNLDAWDQKAADLAEFLKARTGRTLFQLKMEAKLGATLNTPAKVSKFLRDAQKRSFGGMLLEYFVNNLISGPATHMTYFIGNKITTFMEAVPETLVASALGQARAAFGRPGEYVRAGEALEQVKAIGRNIPKSIQGALESVKTGQPTLLPGQQARPLTPFFGDTALTLARNIQNDPVTWREVTGDFVSSIKGLRDGIVAGAQLVAAGGHAGAPLVGTHWSPLGQIPDVAFRGVPVLPIGSAIRMPGRIVAAIHSFDTIANYSRIIAARAYREGIEQGLSGNALSGHIANRTANPPADWMEAAHKQAYASTLMAPGGAFVHNLQQFINTTVNLPLIGATRPLKFIDPFVHIGANVINKAIIERTPLGLFSSELRADLSGKNGNIAQDTAMARMLVGTALSVAFGSLAMEGYITGSGPSDPAKAATWRLAGYQPHSVRIGDIWYQANRLGPMGMHLGIAADLYDVVHDAVQGEFLTAAAHLQHAVTQNILDESFMRGPSELIRAVDDPGRYGEAYLKNIASDFLPFSVGMAQMARAQDPYTRQARTVVDELKRKIPGMSETLFPRRDVWGEEIPNPQALGAAGVTAIYMSKVSNDPVNRAMLDLGIGVAKPERKIRNVELTDQEYDDFARIGGRLAKMRLDTIVRSADWQIWPPHLRHDIIAEVIKRSRTAAEGPLFAKYPHIPRDAAEEQRKRKTGEVAPVPIH